MAGNSAQAALEQRDVLLYGGCAEHGPLTTPWPRACDRWPARVVAHVCDWPPPRAVAALRRLAR